MINSSTTNFCNSGRESGQALPLGMALAAFAVFMGMTLFNTGQVASEKMRVTNTADAAAYSGLLWQSRALNFQSYTNRAMVANQVSIAQAVSIQSWAQYGLIATGNVNRVLGGLPFVGVVTNAMEQGMRMTAPLLSGVANGLLFAADSVNDILSEAQEAMFVTGFVATPEIVNKVVKENDGEFKVDSVYALGGIGLNLHDWNGFTSRYLPENDMAMNTRADIINRSRDAFSRDRNWEYFGFWFYTTPFTRHRIYRRGETRLVRAGPAASNNGQGGDGQGGGASRWEWKAKDSVSLQNRIWRPWRGTKRYELPIGWGQAYANAESGDRSIEPCQPNNGSWIPDPDNGCPRWLGINKSAERMSDRNISFDGTDSRIHMNATYNGIRAYRDLANMPDQENDPRLKLRVEVHTDSTSVTTTDGLNIDDPFNADLQHANGEIAAISSGEIYYHRPELDSVTRPTEYANGYNPFWDVRLVAVSDEERLAAMLIRAPGLLAQASSESSVIPGQQSGQQSGQQPDSQTSGTQTQPSQPETLSSYVEPTADAANSAAPSVAGAGSGQQSGGQGGSTLGDSNTGGTNAGPGSRNLVLSAMIRPDLPDIVGNLDFDALNSANGLLEAGAGNLVNSVLGDQALLQTATSLATMDFANAAGYITDFAEQNLSMAMDRVTDILEERLKEEIEEAILAALQGALQGAFGGGVQSALQDIEQLHDAVVTGLDQVDVITEPFENALNDVLDDVRDASDVIEGEMTRIREGVTTRFEDGALLVEETIQGEIDDLQTDIDLLVSELEIAPTAEAAALVQADIDALVEEQLIAGASDIEEKALLLMEIVNSETDLFTLDLDTAIRVVTMTLDSDNPEDPLAQITIELEGEEDYE